MSRLFHRAGAAMLTVLAINACSDASTPTAPTGPVPPPLTSVAPTTALTYSGEAWAAQVRIPPLINQRISQAGPLPTGGGTAKNAVAAYSSPGGVLQLEVLSASTSGGGSVAQAQAKVNRTKVTLPHLVILLEVVQAFSRVECVGNTLNKSGSTVITSLTINGQKIAVSGAPNQTVPFLGGTLTINEQIPTSNSLVVNGVHIQVTGVLNLIVSHAKADLHNC